MRKNRKQEKLSELGQLMQLLNVYQQHQQGDVQRQLMELQMQGQQQQQEFAQQQHPLLLQGLEADVTGKQSANEFAPQLSQQQLALLAAQISGQGLSNQRMQEMQPIDKAMAEAGLKVAQTQAQNAPQLGQLQMQSAQSGLEDSRVQREHSKAQTGAIQQQGKQDAANQPFLKMMQAGSLAGQFGQPMHPDLMNQLYQQAGLGSGAQPSMATATGTGDMTPYGQALGHEMAFNRGGMDVRQLSQLAPQILEGMQANPQHQWPDMFQAMNYYQQNPGVFHAPKQVMPPANLPGGGSPAASAGYRAANQMLGPMSQPPAPDWNMFGHSGLLQDDVMQKFLQQRMLQQSKQGR